MNKGISKTVVTYFPTPRLSWKAITWARPVGQAGKDPRVGRQCFHKEAGQSMSVAGHTEWIKSLQGLGLLEKYACHVSQEQVSPPHVYFMVQSERRRTLQVVESLAQMFNSYFEKNLSAKGR